LSRKQESQTVPVSSFIIIGSPQSGVSHFC